MSIGNGQDFDPVTSTYITWKSWDASSFGRFTEAEKAYFDAEFLPLLKDCSKPKILEIGFGNGAFLGWSLSRGFDYTGMEIIPDLLSRAEGLGVKTHNSINDTVLHSYDGQYDCVIAFDVLEHIDNRQLPEYFRYVGALLRVGGYFVARFPNGDSPFGRVYQHGDITHVTTLGQFKIAQLATVAGLRVVSVGQPVTTTEGLGLSERLRLAVGMATRSVFERFVSVLYFGGLRVSFAPNAVAILRKP